MLEEVASALGDLKEKVVFVGGATTALYIDDEAAPSPTPSDDVDLVIQIASKLEYSRLEAELRSKGFRDPQLEENAPLCRKWLGEIQVDIMPTDEKILGFTNPWFVEAIRNKIPVFLPNKMKISIFSIPYFLATKLVAFRDRGKSEDIRFSQDLEDICAVLDGCTGAEREIQKASTDVRAFIKMGFTSLLEDEELFEEASHGFIRHSGDPIGRAKRIVEVARTISR